MIRGNIPAETEWEIARLGKFTSSQVDNLFTEPKLKAARERGEFGETAKTYIKSRAAEIITCTSRQMTNWAMEWGNTYEPIAAEKLKIRFPGMEYWGKENPQFFKYSDFSGGSPDGGHIEMKLIFEIKCPEDPANHVEYCLLNSGAELKECERGYYHQIQMNMVCFAKKHNLPFEEMQAVFASYCPLVNEPYQDLKTLFIEPDLEFAGKLPKVMDRAEKELAEIVFALNKNSVAIAFRDEEVSATIIEDSEALKI